MKPCAVLAAATFATVLLAGCSSDGGSTDPVADPSPTPTVSVTPSPSVTAAGTPTPIPTPSLEPTGAPTTAPTKKPTTTPTKAPPSIDALASVRADVESIAPQLESYYRNREYPVDLAQVRQTLVETGVTLSRGNTIGGYVYDGDAVEFTLCIQNTSGAWATYDTAPMTLRDSGATGGCPAS